MFTSKEIEEIQEVFFLAMQAGYAINPPKGTIIELPGSKTINFEHGEYRLLDCWFTTPENSASWGFTMIWRRGIPVWTMTYQGWYLERAIPFLKEALRFAYSHNLWFGGRGPHIHSHRDLRYVNTTGTTSNSFELFRGAERVVDFSQGKVLGWHQFQGMILHDRLYEVS